MNTILIRGTMVWVSAWVIVSLFCGLSIPVYAELGTGWIETHFTKKIHLDDEASLQTFTWTPYKSVCSPDSCADYTYDNATDSETFRIFDSRSNRSEIRLQNDYDSGIWQFEGYVTFYPPLHDESLFQIFGNSGSAATYLMMRGYRDNGGEIRVMGGSNIIASGVYGQEVRINIIHKQNVSAKFYVNGQFIYEKPDTDTAAVNYWKYGCYGTTNGNVPAIVKWRAVRTFRDGVPPGYNPTPPGAYEAEDAVLSGAVIGGNIDGFTGDGFADYINPAGDYVEWTVTADVTGLYDLRFRYALQSGDRPLEIRVNGQVVNAALSFPATGAWTTWAYITLPLQMLNAGPNTVRATAAGSSGPNMDHLLPVPLDVEKAGLAAHYTFDDGTAGDSSGHGNHGLLNGGTVSVEDAGRGKVLGFDGANGSYIRVTNSVSLNAVAAQITIAMWLYTDSTLVRQLVEKGGTSGSAWYTTPWGIRLETDRRLHLHWGNVATLYSTAIAANTWTHIAMTYDSTLASSQAKFYINGLLDAQANWTGGATTNTNDLFIGTDFYNSTSRWAYLGRMDDVYVFNRSLCEAEIRKLAGSHPDGDINGDGSVTLADFSYISAQWLTDGLAVPSADIWPACGGDGSVDIHELMLMVAHFLKTD